MRKSLAPRIDRALPARILPYDKGGGDVADLRILDEGDDGEQISQKADDHDEDRDGGREIPERPGEPEEKGEKKKKKEKEKSTDQRCVGATSPAQFLTSTLRERPPRVKRHAQAIPG